VSKSTGIRAEKKGLRVQNSPHRKEKKQEKPIMGKGQVYKGRRGETKKIQPWLKTKEGYANLVMRGSRKDYKKLVEHA